MPNERLIKIVNAPKIKDDGFLCFVESLKEIPFQIQRSYWITSPATRLPRGMHAHKETRQVLFCLSGQVRMVLDNGNNREEIVLASPEQGIMLEPMVWHEMHDMDESTVLLVLASKEFDAEDYIRNYGEFLRIVKGDATSYVGK